MKDIPMFTTEYGIASLSLKQIPYRGEAYIRIVDALRIDALLKECVSFCRMCGAEHIYASGHPALESYPLRTVIFEMRGSSASEETACLWPVTKENVARWRAIYNERMAAVDNASTLTAADEQQILSDGGACFVHDGKELLGIGWLSEGKLLALAAVKQGQGSRVLRAVLSLWQGVVHLEVASTNERAIRLYEKHGFIKTRQLRSWYCVN